MIGFLSIYWIQICAIFCILLAMGFYYYGIYTKQGKGKLFKTLYNHGYKLMVYAEKRYGEGEGKFKFNYVCEALHKRLPLVAKLFISYQAFRNLVQYIYDKVKDKLDDGVINDSVEYIQEE